MEAFGEDEKEAKSRKKQKLLLEEYTEDILAIWENINTIFDEDHKAGTETFCGNAYKLHTHFLGICQVICYGLNVPL